MEKLRTYDVISTFQRLVVESIDPNEFVMWKNKEEVGGTCTKDGKSEATTPMETRIEILLRQKKRVLLSQIKKWEKRRIKRVFYRFMSHPSNTGASKFGLNAMVASLGSLFHKNDENVKSRITENENLKTVDLSHHALFIPFGKIDMPCELIQHIISFLGYTHSTLTKLGRINFTFFMIMLKHWPKIKINPKNMYEIPLLALRNSSEVTLNFEFSTASRIRMFQLNYLYDQIENVKHLQLQIGDVFKDHLRLFRHLQTRVATGKKYPFEHCKKITFSSGKRDQVQIQQPSIDLSQPENVWINIHLKPLFPRGQFFVNPPSLYLLKGMDQTITHLIFTVKNAKFTNLTEHPQLSRVPMHLRFLRINNVNFMSGNIESCNGFLELLQQMRRRCEDLETFVCETNRKHDQNVMETAKVVVIKYFVEEIRKEIQGDVDLKGRCKTTRTYWQIRKSYFPRFVWKKRK